jgi:hypothetical protein
MATMLTILSLAIAISLGLGLVLFIVRKGLDKQNEMRACHEILERYRWHAAGFESAAAGGIFGMAGHGRERDQLWADEAAFAKKYGYRPSKRYRYLIY